MKKERQPYETVIVGLGKTGLSCARYLHQRKAGRFAVVDSRDQPPQLAALQAACPEVPVHLGSLEREVICSAQALIISPGVSLSEPVIREAIAAGIPVCGDVEIFCREVSAPVIAVTGSNGKSTVVTLLTEMIRAAGFKAAPGGNIGTPVLELLALDEPDFYVLELSSFQLETLSSLNAVASVILNISEDHLDRYPNLDAYLSAKLNVHQGDGVIVFNRDEQDSLALEMKHRKLISYGTDKPEAPMFGLQKFGQEYWLMQGEKKLLAASKVKIPGRHNLSNALAALALGAAIRLPMPAMLRALPAFGGLPHRCQFVAHYQGVSWYNDSKATNVAASCAAIAALSAKGKLILIAGGAAKGADLSPLALSVKDAVRGVVLIGKDAPRLEAVLAGVVPLCFAVSMEVAVRTAAELAQAGDIVLLSPACASLDMFSDYQARGDAYVQALQALLPGGK